MQFHGSDYNLGVSKSIILATRMDVLMAMAGKLLNKIHKFYPEPELFSVYFKRIKIFFAVKVISVISEQFIQHVHNIT